MTHPPGALETVRLSPSRLAALPGACLQGMLGGLCFGAPVPASFPDLPTVAVPSLSGKDGFCELWRTVGAVESGRCHNLRYRRGEWLLFGYLQIAEADLPSAPAGSPPSLQQTTEAVYLEIFACLAELGYPVVARFWNYVPEINRETQGMERYRQFNIGRQNAFLARGRSVLEGVPPACALGSTPGSPLTVAFLATRGRVASLGNPRQFDPFRYPKLYGPRSPTFSRAGLLELNGEAALFISGTSSILGHATRHRGDAARQTRETVANIEAVIAAANAKSAAGRGFRLEDMHYNVYLRQSSDLLRVRSELELRLGSGAAVTYLQADICRADLRVEVEAFGGRTLTVPF